MRDRLQGSLLIREDLVEVLKVPWPDKIRGEGLLQGDMLMQKWHRLNGSKQGSCQRKRPWPWCSTRKRMCSGRSVVHGRSHGALAAAAPALATEQQYFGRRYGPISPNAQLEPNIRTLADLWEEYKFGIGTNKAAKNFTKDEVNGQGDSFKVKYGHRARIWKYQRFLLARGYTIEAANARIIEVFQMDRITTIVKAIQKDQQSTLPYVDATGLRMRCEIAMGAILQMDV
jgi:hypothetical protein